ncbi:DNA polymerase III subunit delta [Thermocrinis minervae]|uniref:DNA-directed DNA polymerase n=1 Tax=Thermocrinis minervae TaxID=381751 RepID=A0A1M6TE26_9AQUI|nr:DNA polymerase III subunit delta [Thermocrinis minervae]SHK55028.1 DNA polymerase III, delta subunit [Thermocrinis minervae]
MKSIIEYRKQIESSHPKPINVIHGEEEYLIKDFIEKLKSKFDVEVLWGDEIAEETLLDKFRVGGLFGERKQRVFVVRRAEDMLKKVKSKDFYTKLAQKLNGNVVFLIFSQKLTTQDLAKEPLATIAKIGDIVEARRLSKDKVKQLVVGRFQKEGKVITPEAIDYLLEHTDYDLMWLKGEVEKLLLLPKKEITLEDVKKLLVTNFQMDVFDFLEAFFTKDLKKALLSLDSAFRSGVQPLQLLAVLDSYALKLYTAKALSEGGRPVEDALSSVGVKHPFQVHNFKRYMQLYSLEDLKALIRGLYFLDFSIKVYFSEPIKSIRNFVIRYLLNAGRTSQQAFQGD